LQLAGTLQGIMCQTLVPRIGGGRVLAIEVLVAMDSIRALIREAKTAQMMSAMQAGKKYGMQTLEDHLNQLLAANLITYEDAVAKANLPQSVKPGGIPAPDATSARASETSGGAATAGTQRAAPAALAGARRPA
jgi:twitching motility protein PilT